MREAKKNDLPVALTIAGSDSGGGAGIQADLLTFAAHGVFGTTAITALTAQNPAGVSAVHPVPAAFVREQAEQVARFFKIGAAKTGMLANAEIICAVADFFEAHREIRLVLDPVMIATSGAKLIDDEAVSVLRERLIPLASLVTPNLDEAEVLLGEKFPWRGNTGTDLRNVSESAEKLADALGVPALLKGGHGNGEEIYDTLAFPKSHGGTNVFMKHPRIEKTNTHGSGCTLSAAIAANLAGVSSSFAVKENLADAVSRAVDYVSSGISKPLSVAGDRFIAHLLV
ncbi:MAG: bifunctional hydroxymethylpyrimidine kinase/phosphomethylpyrimidine kinase [Opitutales bacterium]|nr:bifunctional hydroxymethylpyrimidine kinase/phosphomethylpyrimidine kinase [Opitutales bacterium]